MFPLDAFAESAFVLVSLSIQPTLYQSTTQPVAGRAVEREPRARPEAAAEAGNAALQAQTEQEKKLVEELKTRDREVRAHEQAHAAAAGGLARGGPSFTYQYGPDGRSYAVGGEVSIDTSPGRTPEETISKAKQIRAAALAPTDPSDQDRAVAAAATQLEIQAQKELAQQKTEAQREVKASASGAVDDGTASSSQSQEETQGQQATAVYAAIAAETPGTLINIRA